MADDESSSDSVSDSITEYTENLCKAVKKNSDTLQGNEIDEDDPLSISDLESDASELADTLFSTGGTMTTAARMAVGEVYDMIQGVTRISQVYSMSREEQMKNAVADKAVDQERYSYKSSLALAALTNQSSVTG